MSSQPERIAVIGPFPPLKGGISQHTANVARACKLRGINVDSYSWRSQYPKRLYKRPQIDDTAQAAPGVHWWLRWWNPLSWLRVGRSARKSDLLLFPWVSPMHAPAQLLWLAMARRATRVIHVHNVLPHEPIPMSKVLARLVLGRADLLICHAESIAAEMRMLGITTPVVVTPLASDLAIEATPLPPSPPVRLLFFGTIRKYKGLDIAVAAADQLARNGSEVTMTIAGEVWDEDQAPSEESAALCALPIDLRYGYVPDAELVALLESHHVVVAPYLAATQSGIVPVAFAAGRPVVATAVGGLPDVVDEGANGALAEPGDVQSFKAALQRVLDSLDECAAGAASSTVLWADYAELLADAGCCGRV